jgi:hypothetical protein
LNDAKWFKLVRHTATTHFIATIFTVVCEIDALVDCLEQDTVLEQPFSCPATYAAISASVDIRAVFLGPNFKTHTAVDRLDCNVETWPGSFTANYHHGDGQRGDFGVSKANTEPARILVETVPDFPGYLLVKSAQVNIGVVVDFCEKGRGSSTDERVRLAGKELFGVGRAVPTTEGRYDRSHVWYPTTGE